MTQESPFHQYIHIDSFLRGTSTIQQNQRIFAYVGEDRADELDEIVRTNESTWDHFVLAIELPDWVRSEQPLPPATLDTISMYILFNGSMPRKKDIVRESSPESIRSDPWDDQQSSTDDDEPTWGEQAIQHHIKRYAHPDSSWTVDDLEEAIDTTLALTSKHRNR